MASEREGAVRCVTCGYEIRHGTYIRATGLGTYHLLCAPVLGSVERIHNITTTTSTEP